MTVSASWCRANRSRVLASGANGDEPPRFPCFRRSLPLPLKGNRNAGHPNVQAYTYAPAVGQKGQVSAATGVPRVLCSRRRTT